jgi:hypothetical protein
MNVEINEQMAVATAAKSDEMSDILALALDDLDLVAGGTAIGNLY